MEESFKKALKGYEQFRMRYAQGDQSVMEGLSLNGQQPKIMVVACCDARVDPALILQCDPGDLFVVRNVANLIPPYEKDDAHHGTSAALEFGICRLHVKHLVILGHSQCGGIQAFMDKCSHGHDDFITNWVSLIQSNQVYETADDYAKASLTQSLENCLTFPWIRTGVANGNLRIHLWYFDIKTGQIQSYDSQEKNYKPL